MTESGSAQQVWEAALGELQVHVNKPNFRTWLSKTHGIGYDKDRFIIGVPNTFVSEYLERNQRSLIEKVLRGITKDEVQVNFRVDGNHGVPHPASKSRSKVVAAQQGSLPLFNPRYTFDTFITGTSNQLAFTAALTVAQSPGTSYNPLFIYGGSGLGKTHLLHAIGHKALENNLKVLYVRAEEYTNQLMRALKEKKTEEFRHRYRSVDILLLDDVQFFSGKSQTEENFFHTFDELYTTDHQIAITCDQPPRLLPSLQKRLRSRFEGGLVTDIREPDFDTRLAVLRAKASQKDLDLSNEVLEMIALQIKQNIRALEGSLNRVIAYSKLIREMITPELAARALKDISSNDLPSTPATPHLIMEAVVDSFQLTPSDLKGRKRDLMTALARQVAMYLIRQETDCSLSEIGKELGGRTPATVSHAYQKIAGDINNDPSLKRKVFDIQQEIHASNKTRI
ncbi:MAG: chromosomal replication initiator protein DnaA [Dehalococcoidales bacterium]|nr:MAG: chromosomal replication initiator protein DnaA [Dehalococcoidales bacterium]